MTRERSGLRSEGCWYHPHTFRCYHNILGELQRRGHKVWVLGY